MKKTSDGTIGILLVIIATVLISFKAILVKLAYIENVSVMDLFYYRFLFTLPLLLTFAFYKKKKELFTTIANKKIAMGCAAAGVLGYYLATLFDFQSLKLIDANINRLIISTFPIYVLILNCIIQKKMASLREILVFSAVQIALFFVLGGGEISLSYSDKVGVFLAMLTALSYSGYIVINQQIGKKIGSVLFTVYALSFSFIFINIHYISTFNPESSQIITAKAYLIIMTMAVLCTFLPLLLISEGIKRIGASRFALINAAGPVMTIFFAFIFLSETMSAQQFVGALVVVGVLFFSEQSRK